MGSQFVYRITSPDGGCSINMNTSKEVAERIGCSSTYVRTAVNKGKLVKGFEITRVPVMREEDDTEDGRIMTTVKGKRMSVVPNIATCCMMTGLAEDELRRLIRKGIEKNGVCYDFDLDENADETV